MAANQLRAGPCFLAPLIIRIPPPIRKKHYRIPVS
jgi:hypothetical protein